MGLFSSHKGAPSKEPVPPEILAEVIVNGEKIISSAATQSVAPTSTPSAVPTSPPVATSPFLKPKTTVNAAPFPVTQDMSIQPAAVAAAPANLPSQESGAPKAFNFSDQAPLPAEIHFTDIPDEKPKEIDFPEELSVSRAPIPDFSHITQDKALTEKQKEHLAPLKTNTSSAKPEKKSFPPGSNALSIGVFVLILLFISGGSWYYLNTRKTEPVMPDMSIGTMTPPPVVNKEAGPDSVLTDQPNYIVLDVETVTISEVKNAIEKEHLKIVAQGITTPVEYLVVDMNNNPVAFSRFSFLLGVTSPNPVVDASLEPFSLYLYNDQGALHIALAVTLAEGQEDQFTSNPALVAESFKNFLYPDGLSGNSFTNQSFQQSSYKENTISYINIDQQKNFSFDMTVQEGILTFANSKNTIRVVIDKRTVPTTE